MADNSKEDCIKLALEDFKKGFFSSRSAAAKAYDVPLSIYNMDETGFQMGMISTAKVICGSETRASYAKTIQPGNREWVTAVVAVNATECHGADHILPTLH